MIQRIKKRCTGCNACIASCNVDALTLITDKNGFWYPEFDKEKCVGCRKCVKSCPVYEKEDQSVKDLEAYIAWNKKEEMRKNSSSGGVFSALAQKVLDEGGYVAGAALDRDIRKVKHILVSDPGELSKLRGSKYVESFIEPQLYNRIEKILKDGDVVLFSGTPCQIAGLKCYLDKSYDNLLTADIVCHGVPSPYAWGKYLDDMERKTHDHVIDANFRAKPNGWKKYEITLRFGKKSYSKRFIEDVYGKSFIHNMFLRECCYQCEFKEFPRQADISLGDFWRPPAKYGLDDNGYSLVLCNTKKGKEMFQHISSGLAYDSVEIESAYPGNYALLKSSAYFENRDKAFRQIESRAFGKVVNRMAEDTIYHKVKRKIGRLFRG